MSPAYILIAKSSAANTNPLQHFAESGILLIIKTHSFFQGGHYWQLLIVPHGGSHSSLLPVHCLSRLQISVRNGPCNESAISFYSCNMSKSCTMSTPAGSEFCHLGKWPFCCNVYLNICCKVPSNVHLVFL